MARMVILWSAIAAMAYTMMPNSGAAADALGFVEREVALQSQLVHHEVRMSCGNTRKILRTPIPSAAALPEPGPGTTVFNFEAVPLGGGMTSFQFESYARLKGTLSIKCGSLYIRDSVVPDLTGRHLDFVSGEVTIAAATDFSTGVGFRMLELTLHADAPIGVTGLCGVSPAPLVEHNGTRYRLTCASGGKLTQVKVTIADGKVQMDNLWFTL